MAIEDTSGPIGEHFEWTWKVIDKLDEDLRREIRRLVEEVSRTHGISPLSDDGLAALEDSPPGSRHGLVIGPEGKLAGYLQVRPDPLTCEAVASRSAADSPAALALLSELGRLAGRPVPMWVRGEHDPASTLTRTAGGRQVRELLQLRAALAGLGLDESGPFSPATQAPPAGLRPRTFVPGADDDAWLAANRTAFGALPGQAGWTRSDLVHRLTAPWFRADGFFLLVDENNRIAGFHWTKIHPPGGGGATADESLGEVYILGVIPSYRGRGLAEYLIWTGLDYLRREGIRTVLLYVDADNIAARRLYDRFGFQVHSTDYQYLVG
ncbi:MAG: mycothiol synthase [Candidatus Nanopelagicales bacterium]|nr:mycothiol synthase [Candidatus Nanopelagicales bacterium]